MTPKKTPVSYKLFNQIVQKLIRDLHFEILVSIDTVMEKYNFYVCKLDI